MGIPFGDETRDIDAAKKNNIQSVAVTWEFTSTGLYCAKARGFAENRTSLTTFARGATLSRITPFKEKRYV